MLWKIIRAKIKLNPGLYRAFYPGVHLFRQVRYWLGRTKAEMFRDCCFALSRSLPAAYFVNIGANDGIADTPGIRILLGNRNWKGLLVEPVPYCFAKLKDNFSDSERFMLEQVAIGPAKGRTVFYYVEQSAICRLPNLPAWYDKLGSFNRDHILKHLGPSIEPFIVELPVEVLSLTEVVRRNGIPQIHLLHIDTEGYDFEVLKTLDFSSFQPVVIYIEHVHLDREKKAELRRFLRKRRYSVYDCGMDYFAVDKRRYRHCVRKTTA